MTLTKIPFLGLNRDDDDSVAPIGICRDAKNVMPLKKGLSSPSSLQTIAPLRARANSSLPAGTNTCIGTYEDGENNQLIYFVYNSNGNHGVYAFDADSGIVKVLIQDSILNFSETSLITGIGVTGDLLFWSDGVNPQRQINITRTYSSPDESEITFAKQTPVNVTASVVTDANAGDRISKDSYQFRVRYIYLDDNKSPLSQYSNEIKAPNYYVSGSNNVIRVSHTIDSDLLDYIKKIEFIAIKNNDGIHSIFSEQNISGGTYTYTSDYKGENVSKIIAEDEIISSSGIPRESSALSVFKDRVFLNFDKYNYSTPSASLSLSVVDETVSDTTRVTAHLRGCEYEYGLEFGDKYGRTSGVVVKERILIPNEFAKSYNNYQNNDSHIQNIEATFSGTAPSWCTFINVVRSENLTYQDYMHFPATVMFYIRDHDEGESLNPEEILDNGKVYHAQKQTGDDKIYIKTPTNLPAKVTNEYKLRILTDRGQDIGDKYNIIDVDQDKIVIDNPVSDWTAIDCRIYVEIFKEKDITEEIFYQVHTEEVTPGNAYNLTRTIRGAEHYIVSQTPITTGRIFGFVYDDYDETNYTSTYSRVYNAFAANIISPSPAITGRTIETQSTSVEEKKEGEGRKKRKTIAGKFLQNLTDPKNFLSPEVTAFKTAKDVLNPEEPNTTTVSDVREVYTFDYNKKFWNRGVPTVEIQNLAERSTPNLLAYSNRRIQGANFNDTDKFDPLNKYAIPTDRTKLKKLVAANNILLAIHERNATSLYVDENVIISGDGQEQLTKSDDVINYDRPLRGGYGTLHPESVVEHNGKVFWFDASKGDVLRYDLNGITPIGSVYKMKTYFRQKAQEFGKIPDISKVVGGYDPQIDMYYLTFKKGTYNLLESGTGTDNGGSGTVRVSLDSGSLIAGEECRVRITHNASVAEPFHVKTIGGTILATMNAIDADETGYVTFTVPGGMDDTFDIEYFAFDGTFTYSVYSEISSDDETIGFLDRQGEERWVSFYDFIPEYFGKINNRFFSFKNGIIYEHNADDASSTPNVYYDATQHDSVIKVLHNENYYKEKVYESISLQTVAPVGGNDKAWAVTATNPEGQETELETSHFTKRDGVYYADFLRDKNTNPDLLSGSQIAIRHGKVMRSKTLDITLTLTPGSTNIGDGFFVIDAVNVAYQMSPGHRNS